MVAVAGQILVELHILAVEQSLEAVERILGVIEELHTLVERHNLAAHHILAEMMS